MHALLNQLTAPLASDEAVFGQPEAMVSLSAGGDSAWSTNFTQGPHSWMQYWALQRRSRKLADRIESILAFTESREPTFHDPEFL